MAKIKSPATNQTSTMKILNDLRQYTPAEYQSAIPTITSVDEVPKVCDIIYGSNALVTAVSGGLAYGVVPKLVSAALEENIYAALDKGYCDPSETIEEIFVDLVQALPYSAEKAKDREFKRYLPNIRTAMHATNWKVLYPVTIDPIQLRGALKDGDLATYVQGVVAANYRSAYNDHRLLVKYMLIKAMSHGFVTAVSVGDGTKTTDAAIKFRGAANKLQFPTNKYNLAKVDNNTPFERMAIFMDADYNAQFDVDVLAESFHMDRSTFIGRLFLMDDWTSFDNDRFSVIRAESDGLEEVTATELALLADVKAVIVDIDWFQIYQSVWEVRTQQSATGLYDTYVLHDWKVISESPFANIIMFVTNSSTIAVPDSITGTVVSKTVNSDGIVLSINTQPASATLRPANVLLQQTEAATEDGIVIAPYGIITIPIAKSAENILLKAKIDDQGYTATANITSAVDVGDTVTLAKDV